MDDGWLRAGRRLAERLHKAAEAQPDLRCMFYTGFELKPGELLIEFGEWFGEGWFESTFDSNDGWVQCGYFRKSRGPIDRHQRSHMTRFEAFQASREGAEERNAILRRVSTLLDESCYWFRRRPEETPARVTDLIGGQRYWCDRVWLLWIHRLAWQGFTDTTLGTRRFYPAVLLLNIEYREWCEAIRKSDQEPTKESAERKYLEISDAHYLKAEQYVPSEERFASILPIDPLTASALAIEWIVDVVESEHQRREATATAADSPTLRDLLSEAANATTGGFRLVERALDLPLAVGSAPEGESQSTTAPASDTANRYERLEALQPAHRNAYFSFLYAEAKLEKRLEDREAWEWLTENGVRDAERSDLQDYELPAFDTWSRYLRSARKSLDERKYTPRSGRQRSG